MSRLLTEGVRVCGAGVGHLLPAGVDTPALCGGGVALGGPVGPALVALGDVLTSRRARPEERQEAVARGCLHTVSVALTRRRLPLYNIQLYITALSHTALY